jgi:hypothetical protein
MNNISEALKQHDIAEGEILSITTNLNETEINFQLWNMDLITWVFQDWLYLGYSSAVFAELKEVRVVKQSPLVNKRVNERFRRKDLILHGIDEYVEIQIWDVNVKEDPILTVVASEVEVVTHKQS